MPESKAERVAKIILPEIESLGFRNRGVKPRKELFVLSETKMLALIIECALCGSEIDMKNGVTLRIIELNNIKDVNLIYPGQRLKVK